MNRKTLDRLEKLLGEHSPELHPRSPFEDELFTGISRGVALALRVYLNHYPELRLDPHIVALSTMCHRLGDFKPTPVRDLLDVLLLVRTARGLFRQHVAALRAEQFLTACGGSTPSHPGWSTSPLEFHDGMAFLNLAIADEILQDILGQIFDGVF